MEAAVKKDSNTDEKKKHKQPKRCSVVTMFLKNYLFIYVPRNCW